MVAARVNEADDERFPNKPMQLEILSPAPCQQMVREFSAYRPLAFLQGQLLVELLHTGVSSTVNGLRDSSEEQAGNYAGGLS